MQQQRENIKARRAGIPPVPPSIDLAATEQSFLESSSRECAKLPSSQFAYAVPEPKFSDISSIQPSDATFPSKTPCKRSKNVVCSTPLRYISPAMGVPAAIVKSADSSVSISKGGYQPAAAVSSMIKEVVVFLTFFSAFP
ncbi:hypothetical protein COOONC_00253 [Cooperia oncophora]